ncbi:MAG: hypothetical protein QW186_06425 [Candidatus Bathyarchaeia archaeon]
MVYASIQHIIGTAALIGLAISAALAYQITVGYIETSVLQSQLNQTAEYVSMSMANMISLTEFTYGILSTGTVIKRLSLPVDLSGKTYIIRLVKEVGRYRVRVEIDGRSDLYATSPILVNSTATSILILTDETIQEFENIRLSDESVKPKTYVYGGNPNIVIWCEKIGDVIYAGLGLREPG